MPQPTNTKCSWEVTPMSAEKPKWGSYAELARVRREKQRREAAEAAEAVKPEAVAIENSAKMAESAKMATSVISTNSAISTDSANGRVETRPLAESAISTESAKMADFAVKDGWTPVPHTILDTLSASLDDSSFKLYVRLFRLSYGYKGYDHCRVSLDALARGCNMGARTVQRALEKLEHMGLVARLHGATAKAAKVPQQGIGGNTYRIVVPGFNSAISANSAKTADSAKMAESAEMAYIKEKKKENKKERAPVAVAPAPDLSVYDVRRIQARFVEAHRGDETYTKERLRADIRTALIGEGREPNDRLIDDAIGA
jgi:hypothetical protein